jgi:hypothetical protein
MNELNEKQLSGWRPRQASAGLRQKIFRAPEAVVIAWDFTRLAPAMACLFFTLVTLHFNGAPGWRGSSANSYADFSSGSNSAAFSDRAQEPENHLSRVTFDWTNHSNFKSSMCSLSGQTPATNFSN